MKVLARFQSLVSKRSIRESIEGRSQTINASPNILFGNIPRVRGLLAGQGATELSSIMQTGFKLGTDTKEVSEQEKDLFLAYWALP